MVDLTIALFDIRCESVGCIFVYLWRYTGNGGLFQDTTFDFGVFIHSNTI